MLAAGVVMGCATAAAFAAGVNATVLVGAGAGGDPGVFPSAGVLAAGVLVTTEAGDDPGVLPSAAVLAGAGGASVASAVVTAGAGGDPDAGVLAAGVLVTTETGDDPVVFPSAGVLAAGAVPASAGGASVPGVLVSAGAGAVLCSVLPASSRGGVVAKLAGGGAGREAGWVAASQIHGLPGTRRRGKQSGAGILSSVPFILVNKYVPPLESKM